jgi:NAD(P)-dependent dehydrogenase (short-subunit alcohol dehydrogenase family)
MTDQVALITGASSGIGRSAALQFAREGTAVVATDILDEQGQELVEQIRARGGRAVFVHTDVTREEDLQAAVAAALREYGGLDFAINNAGLELSGMPIVDSTAEALERTMAINVRGVLLGMKHQIPALIERRTRSAGRTPGPAVVNVSSIAGLIGFPGAAIYVASKHAVIGLTRSAALECAPAGIRVNAICPGAIQTPMIDRFVHQDADAKADLIARHPLGRIGQPEEIASAIVWLCSEGAGFITGQYITIDGGYTAQ